MSRWRYPQKWGSPLAAKERPHELDNTLPLGVPEQEEEQTEEEDEKEKEEEED